MSLLLISYNKSKRETVLESLSQIEGNIIYDSDIINVLRFRTEISHNIVANIDGIIAVSVEDLFKRRVLDDV